MATACQFEKLQCEQENNIIPNATHVIKHHVYTRGFVGDGCWTRSRMHRTLFIQFSFSLSLSISLSICLFTYYNNNIYMDTYVQKVSKIIYDNMSKDVCELRLKLINRVSGNSFHIIYIYVMSQSKQKQVIVITNRAL